MPMNMKVFKGIKGLRIHFKLLDNTKMAKLTNSLKKDRITFRVIRDTNLWTMIIKMGRRIRQMFGDLQDSKILLVKISTDNQVSLTSTIATSI